MTTHDARRPIELRVSAAELELLRIALRHLLASEDDPGMIEEIKVFLARLPRPDRDD